MFCGKQKFVMADFKFSCPGCGQHISCDVGYSGMQINCPSCKQAIIVPQAPRSAAAPPAAPPPPPGRSAVPPPPPLPPAAPGLATRQSTAAPAGGQRFPGAIGAAQPPKKSGSALKVVAMVLAALIGGTGGFFGVRLALNHFGKSEAKGNPAAQVAVATTQQTAAALDILSKVRNAYTNLTSLNVRGTAVSVIDMSGVTAADLNPNAKNNAAAKRRAANIPKGITNSADITIKCARPDLYLLESASKMEMGRNKSTNIMAVWFSGGTNFNYMGFGAGAGGFKRYTTVKDRSSALMMTMQSGGLAMSIVDLFFNDENSMADFMSDWQQGADESLNGRDCYIIIAKMMGQKLKIWVNKSSYMLVQSQITLGGAVSDTEVQGIIDKFDTRTNKTQQQIQQEQTMAKQQAAMMAKIRGTVTETYDDVQLNPALTADDFNYNVPKGVRLVPAFTPQTTTTSSGSTLEERQRNACINNLRQIDAAKNEWALEKGKAAGAACTEDDIKSYLKNNVVPKCPANGKYTIGKVGESPTCSVDGHKLP